MPQMQKNKKFTFQATNGQEKVFNLNRRNLGFNPSQTFDHHQIQVYASNTSHAIATDQISLTFKPVNSDVFASLSGSTTMDNGDVFLVDVGPWEEIKVTLSATHGLATSADNVTVVCNSFVAFGGMGQ